MVEGGAVPFDGIDVYDSGNHYQPRRTKRRARVAIDRAGLLVDGELWLRRDDAVAASVVVLDGGQAGVRFDARDRRVLALRRMPRHDARAMVRAMGLGADAVARSYRVALPQPWLIALMAALVGLPLASIAISQSLWMAFAVPVAMLGLLALTVSLQPKLTVSKDVLEVTGVGARKVAVADIAGVHMDSSRSQLIVGVRGEPSLFIGRIASLKPHDTLAEIQERIEDAMAANLAARPPLPELPARGDMPLAEWIAKLRSHGVGGGPFRDDVVSAEQLFAVVECPAHDTFTRAAAAAALAPTLSEDGRRRLRVASETAPPKLRVALDTATDGADDALLEVVEELERAGARR